MVTAFAPVRPYWVGLPIAPRLSSIDDCDRPHLARTLCRSHYDRWRYSGREKATAAEVLAPQRPSLRCRRQGTGRPVLSSGHRSTVMRISRSFE
jgi:hypothetical protein